MINSFVLITFTIDLKLLTSERHYINMYCMMNSDMRDSSCLQIYFDYFLDRSLGP